MGGGGCEGVGGLHTSRHLPPGSPSRAGCPSPGPRPVRALRRGPATCRLPTGLASGSPHAPVRRGGGARGGGGKGAPHGRGPAGGGGGGAGGAGAGGGGRRVGFLFSHP